MRLRALRTCAGPCARPRIIALAAALWLILPASVPAQTDATGGVGLGLPATTVAPAEEGAPEETPLPTTAPKHHRITPAPVTEHELTSRATAAPVKSVTPEPAQARLLLKEDAWIYAQPSNKSAQIEKGERGKFVMVTGTTHYFLRVKLNIGKEGYVLAEAVAIDTPADKLFTLTHDAPVLDAPNRWGKKLAAVHQGHAVHVVAIALSYMKIKMKNGLKGYIPASALE
jgi:hypothetical protein